MYDCATGLIKVQLPGLARAWGSDDLESVVASFDENHVQVFESRTGRKLSPSVDLGSNIQEIKFVGPNNRLLAMEKNGLSRLIHFDPSLAGREVVSRQGKSLESFVVGPDGDRVLTVLDQREQGLLVEQWDVAGIPIGEAMHDGPRSRITEIGHPTVRYSPDQSMILGFASGSDVSLWHASTGKQVIPPLGQDWVRDAWIDSKNRRIVAADHHDRAKLWDAKSGRLIADLKHYENGEQDGRLQVGFTDGEDLVGETLGDRLRSAFQDVRPSRAGFRDVLLERPDPAARLENGASR